MELHSKVLHSRELSSNEANNEIPKERYISSQERQHIIDELRLIEEHNNGIPKNSKSDR